MLDGDMPLMNGAETISALRKRAPQLPIVLMSGEMDAVSPLQDVVRLGKPFQLEQLLATVGTLLGRG
jgi:DNA-binding response OmpR family regulator